MIELLVLGVGSPFGDDQLGWCAAQLLQKRAELQPFSTRLKIDWSDRPGLRLLELMKEADTVFLIDAIKTGAPIGTIHRFVNKEIHGLSSELSSHSFGVLETLQLGFSLNSLPPKVLLYGLEIDGIEPISKVRVERPLHLNKKQRAGVQTLINKDSNTLSMKQSPSLLDDGRGLVQKKTSLSNSIDQSINSLVDLIEQDILLSLRSGEITP